MATARPRPLSPHLSIWRWRVHMAVSIMHRVTGHGMALVGVPIFVWWLVAAASGEEAYRDFYAFMTEGVTGLLAKLAAVAFTYVFFQHMASGLRHLVMDTGAAFEIQTSKRTATSTFIVAALLTALTWIAIYLHKGF
jgi:succinate dehydrogenase / fumarate reductase, cytochrome b subunit